MGGTTERVPSVSMVSRTNERASSSRARVETRQGTV
jgi:hypothetical protein